VKELSLFSGAGGGLLATKHLLGWECKGYVEYNEYCQKVLIQRIKDGYLDAAPIFGDINEFISEGYAGSYQGMVDVITGGFPCQPFSVAGKQAGENDPRNMWPQTRDTIGIVRPRYIFLENVSGLLSHAYIWAILSDITKMGYDCRWGIVGAGDISAPHKRERVWVVGVNSRCNKCNSFKAVSGVTEEAKACRVLQGFLLQEGKKNNSELWSIDQLSSFQRMAHGVAHRVDRLKAIGNGQVPAVAALAWQILSQEVFDFTNEKLKSR